MEEREFTLTRIPNGLRRRREPLMAIFEDFFAWMTDRIGHFGQKDVIRGTESEDGKRERSKNENIQRTGTATLRASASDFSFLSPVLLFPLLRFILLSYQFPLLLLFFFSFYSWLNSELSCVLKESKSSKSQFQILNHFFRYSTTLVEILKF